MPTEKILTTRIQLKYDTIANWTAAANQFVLLAGEKAVCSISTLSGNLADANGGSNEPPRIMTKTGDGVHTFNELPWDAAIAADVYAWAKQPNPPSVAGKADKKVPATVNNIAVLDSTGNLADGGKTIAQIEAEIPTGALASKDKVADGDITGTISDSHIASATTWNSAVQNVTFDNGITADFLTASKSGTNVELTAHFVDGSVAVTDTSGGAQFDVNADYVDGALATTNKLLTKSKADGYYATAAQGTKADGAVQSVASGDATALTVSTTNHVVTVTPNTGAVSSNDGKLVTAAQVKSYVDTSISGLGTPLKFSGAGTSFPSSPAMGDVYLRTDTNKEYVYDGTNWIEFGDEGSYALKTTTVTGTGYLTGGGDLSANRTIDINAETKTKIDGAIQSISTDHTMIEISKSGTTTYVDLNTKSNAAITLSDNNGLEATLTNVDGTVSATNKLATQSTVTNTIPVTGVTGSDGIKVTTTNKVANVEIDDTVVFRLQCGSATVNVD